MTAAPERGAADALRLRGLRAGNLKDVDVDLPLGAWTAVHGPSGAGKSALLFGVLQTVARQRFRILEDPRALPGGAEDWLQPLADSVEGLTPTVASAGEIPRSRRKVRLGDALDLWRLPAGAWELGGGFACADCGHRWRPASYASLLDRAQGFADEERVQLWSVAAGLDSAELLRGGWTRVRIAGSLVRLEEAPEKLPEGTLLLLDRFRWSAARHDRYAEALRIGLQRGESLVLERDGNDEEHPGGARCPSCARPPRSHADPAWFRDETLADRWLLDASWTEWCARPVHEWAALPSDAAPRAARLIELLVRTGLGHLSATRTLGTLSLGEARRLELVSWLALVRSGQTVLLDEPGMGLHGKERSALAGLLQELVAQGNTVFTADPAREFLEAAHHWLLLGPEGGPNGGRLLGHGPRATLPPEQWEVGASTASKSKNTLRFRNLRTRHLNIPNLRLPTDRVVALCGVSGSGKSTLLDEELLPRLREERGFEGKLPEGGVTVLLERALRHSPISTVATLGGVWQEVRAIFVDGEEGRIRGLAPADLVARPGQGACLICAGRGVDPQFLPCVDCDGLGLRNDLLDLRVRGRALREWLTTPLESLEKRLPARGRLRATVRHLIALGMGARTLGERGRHLSLGERGRIALARALASARPGAPRLFLLDEPCLGLPVPEARRVVELLRSLCAEGHGFWVVEHHEVFLRAADWAVELGPGAGPEGGQLLLAGTAEELLAADTPTGHWLRTRGQAATPPEPPPRVAVRSEAYPDDASRTGRARLEEELRRELASRSPLLADVHGGGLLVDDEDSAARWMPVAWPIAPPRGTSLRTALGLDGCHRRIYAQHAVEVCTACGGRGPWASLEAAASQQPSDAEWLLVTPLAADFLARAEHPDWLRAAGFRRFLRGDEDFRWRRDEQRSLQVGDRLWLDRIRADAEDVVPRLRDAAHHAALLGDAQVQVLNPENFKPMWGWTAGACADCGRIDAGIEARLGKYSQSALDALPLQQALDVLEHAAGGDAECARARDLLAGSSLLSKPGVTPLQSCNETEAGLARLAGFLLHPVEGVALLADQPLSGLPEHLARRFAVEMLAPTVGAFRITDPEGWSHPADAAALTLANPPRSSDTAFDFAAWTVPPRAAADQTVGEALGLVPAMVTHFLRTEGARLLGWVAADLDRRRSRLRCPECRGSGGPRPHPELQLPCPLCTGGGWSREASAAEDRGLRWTDLPAATLEELAEHFRDSPTIGRILSAAGDLGMGAARWGSSLRRLPRAHRMLAPLAAELAKPRGDLDGLRIGLALAGLSPLEAREASARIDGFYPQGPTLEWRDRHPAVEPSPA